jgi:myo-inositol 2-dehydrogenase / D-chiro-inositol 1-dehydrogenase
MSAPTVAPKLVNIGILGVGRIGAMHAELIARRTHGAAVACVFDAYRPSADAVGAQFGVPVAATVEEVLNNPDVDAVAICSSTDTHVDLLIAAAQAGKAIFCEKPISLSLAEVDRALAAIDLAGVPVQIGFNRRFDPSHKAVRDAVADGTVGDVHLVRISSRDPQPPPLAYVKVSGGIFLDMTIHDLDMARFVTGSEVVSVFARGAVRVDPAIGEAGDLDTVVLVLVHENGAITTIDNSRQAVYGYDQRVEVFGSGGMVASENPYMTSTVVRDASGSHLSAIPFFFLDRYVPAYVAEWAAFVAMVRDGSPSPAGTADGRAPLVIGLAALKSIKENRAVLISEITG